MSLKRLYSFTVLLVLLAFYPATAKLAFNQLPFALPDKPTQMAGANRLVDSMIASNPMLNSKVVYNAVEKVHVFDDKSLDFYVILTIVLMLGVVRYANPKYFQNLWSTFRSPGHSHASKEQLEVAGFSNLFMNIFFAMVSGLYVYYLVRANTPQTTASMPHWLLMLMLMAGMGLIYLAKYMTISFGGWAFKLDAVSKSYIFNIFLVNKIMALALLPFVLLIAFASPAYASPAIIVSGILVALLFVSRYIRSWQVFGSFFQFSKFHFFTYLCASEILPLAVLMKLLVRGMLY